MADPEERPVPLGDLEVAGRIARATRSGRPADRSATLDQLLAAFGEQEPTAAARTRVASALEMAGVRVEPPVTVAEPGRRVALSSTKGGSSGATRAALGILALVVVIIVAALVASLGGGGDDGGRRVADLPAGTATATEPPETTASRRPAQKAAKAADAEGRGLRRGNAAREARRLRTIAERDASSLARRAITVRVVPTRPTYACVEDGDGKVLFAGTMDSRQTFRARRIRMNLGLGTSTRVTVNGDALRIDGSPIGFDLTRSRSSLLGEGERPQCAGA